MSHIMIDGIAGSGKSTVARAFAKSIEERGLTVFSLEEFEKREHRLPTIEEIAHADILWVAEPTKSWVGAAIRQEILRTDDPYSAKIVAHAFAIDRAILYQRLIIPAKKQGMHILHERGVFTSIAYQGAMQGGYSREEITHLPGNDIALSALPDHFIVFSPRDVEQGLERIGKRNDLSRGIAAEYALLCAAQDWFVNSAPDVFKTTSCTYRILPTEREQDIVVQQGITLLSSLFSLPL